MLVDSPLDGFPVAHCRDKEQKNTAWQQTPPTLTKATPAVEMIPSLSDRHKPRTTYSPAGWSCQVFSPDRSSKYGNLKTGDMVNEVLQQAVRQSLQYELGEHRWDPLKLSAAAMDPTLPLADFHVFQASKQGATGFEPHVTMYPHTEHNAQLLQTVGYIKLHTEDGGSVTIFTSETTIPPHRIAVRVPAITDANVKEALVILSKLHHVGYTKQVGNISRDNKGEGKEQIKCMNQKWQEYTDMNETRAYSNTHHYPHTVTTHMTNPLTCPPPHLPPIKQNIPPPRWKCSGRQGPPSRKSSQQQPSQPDLGKCSWSALRTQRP
jgi:hypothetical protein